MTKILSYLSTRIALTLAFCVALNLPGLAASVRTTGGKLGQALDSGVNDIDGDGINDVSLATFPGFGAIGATGGFGLTGESGGGAAWVRSNSVLTPGDRGGQNEAFYTPFRGNLLDSSDNWSKVHFSSADGWVKWQFGSGVSPVIPLVFVREAAGEDLSPADCEVLVAQAAQIVRTGGKLGQALAGGGNDVDGDGTNDVSLATFPGFGTLDASGAFGITGESGNGAAWVRSVSALAPGDRNGQNEAYYPAFRGGILNSSDNWSKVHFSSGDGWVKWQFSSGVTPVIPLVFVREKAGQNLSAAQAEAMAFGTPVAIKRLLAVSFLSEPGVTYTLNASSDLVNFTPTSQTLVGTGGQLNFYVEANQASQYYKVTRN